MTYLEAWNQANIQSVGLLEDDTVYAICYKGRRFDKVRYFVMNPSNGLYYSNMSLWSDVLDKKLADRMKRDLDYPNRAHNVANYESKELAELFNSDHWQVMSVNQIIKFSLERLDEHDGERTD